MMSSRQLRSEQTFQRHLTWQLINELPTLTDFISYFVHSFSAGRRDEAAPLSFQTG